MSRHPALERRRGAAPAPDRRYTVISADTHCGADVRRLPALSRLEVPRRVRRLGRDLRESRSPICVAPTAYRSWDSERRLAEHETDGIVAEVLFPNTVPPFFEEGNLVRPAARRGRLRTSVGRRPGPQPMARRFLRRGARTAGGHRPGVREPSRGRAGRDLVGGAARSAIFGGVLVPSIPPGSALPLCTTLIYDPLWRLCEELGAVVNVHGGSGLPEYGELDIARAIMLVELPWFSHRALWHLIFGGVLERFPNLKVALTEQGVAWLPRGLETLDWFYGRMVHGGAAEALYFGAAAQGMTMKPSEYFARNVWVGAVVPAVVGVGPAARLSAAIASCGATTTPTPKGPGPSAARRLRVAFAGESPRRRAALRRRQRGAALRLRPREPSRPWRRPLRSARRARWLSRWFRATTRPGSTSNAFDTTQVLRAW